MMTEEEKKSYEMDMATWSYCSSPFYHVMEFLAGIGCMPAGLSDVYSKYLARRYITIIERYTKCQKSMEEYRENLTKP